MNSRLTRLYRSFLAPAIGSFRRSPSSGEHATAAPQESGAASRILASVLLCAAGCGQVDSAHAQRAAENAVAEANDAFGTTVGREAVGLYTSGDARGFSPTTAGNLRIGGMYFDMASSGPPADHVVRGSTVHVGIGAQGFPFPAPTGVVDFQLRRPGDDPSASMLLGIASYDQAYAEFDAHAPVIADTLSFGGGLGYSRNSGYQYAHHSDELSFGANASWRPTDAISVTPFWSGRNHRDNGAKPTVFIGTNGVPRYRASRLPRQSWADWSSNSRNSGVLVNAVLSDSWLLELGAFRSGTTSPDTNFVFLTSVDGLGRGDYAIAFVPAQGTNSNSGEVRLTKTFETSRIRSNVYLSVRGRDRSSDYGGDDLRNLGSGTTTFVPQLPKPDYLGGPMTRVSAEQVTPAVAYQGIWREVGQLSLGLQKSYYRRTIAAPDAAEVSSRSRPWLYNAATALFATPRLVFYGSATRGFEEVGVAPTIAMNRDEAVPAQLTRQVDAGLRYQFTPTLQLVAGAFRISKPYFDLDGANFYRQVGSTSNRGFELSLSGALTEQLTVVAGYTYIDPEVRLEASASGRSTTAVAVGPTPGLLRANLQYQMARISGLVLDAGIERTSSRYARYPEIHLPSVTTLDMGARYSTKLFDKAATWRLRLGNVTGEYGVTAQASGQLMPLDGRNFALSLAVDL